VVTCHCHLIGNWVCSTSLSLSSSVMYLGVVGALSSEVTDPWLYVLAVFCGCNRFPRRSPHPAGAPRPRPGAGTPPAALRPAGCLAVGLLPRCHPPRGRRPRPDAADGISGPGVRRRQAGELRLVRGPGAERPRLRPQPIRHRHDLQQERRRCRARSSGWVGQR
jgi:hypothetical protein